jgi:WD40 repeat protein
MTTAPTRSTPTLHRIAPWYFNAQNTRIGAAALLLGCTLSAALLAADEPAAPVPTPAPAAIQIAEIKRTSSVDFEKELLPILRENCLACHSASKPKADLVLETPASIQKGGESGPAVVPGKGLESLLVKVAAHAVEPFMPPKDNKAGANNLTPEQLGLVKLWIDQGATGIVTSLSGPVKWQPLPPGFNPINAVAVSPDGQFAACGRANQIFVYHIPSGELITRLTDPALLKSGEVTNPGVADRDLIQSLGFSPDGALLAAGGFRVAKIWKHQPNSPKKSFEASHGDLKCMAASSDGKWLAFAGADHKVRLWDLEAGKQIHEWSGHSNTVTSLKFSSDDAKLVSGSTDKTMRVWAVAEGKEIGKIDGGSEILAITWAANGSLIAAGGADHQIRIWSATNISDQAQSPLKHLTGHAQGVTCLDAFAGSNKIVSGSNDGSVRIWDLEKGQQLRQMDHGAAVTSVAVRADGKRIASVGANKLGKLWNAEDGAVVAELRGHRHALEAVAARERSVQFAKSEVGFHKSALEASQKQQQTDSDALKKAAEAKSAAEKTLAEKQEVSKKATEEKGNADKMLASASASVKVSTQNKELAEKLAQQSSAQSKAAAEVLAQATAALAKAVELKEAAYKFVIEAATQAKMAGDRASEAKAASEKDPQNKLLADARDAAEKFSVERIQASEAAVDRAAASKAALEQAQKAKATAEQAAAEVGNLAKSANDSKATAEKALADASAQQKEADTKQKAADKALGDATQALKSAEMAKSRADENLQSAEVALKKTEETVKSNQASLASAEALQKKAESELELAKKTAAEFDQPLLAVALSPDGKTLVTAGADRLVHSWNGESGVAHDVFSGSTASVFGTAFVANSQFVSVASDGKIQVWNLHSEWTHERTIGTGDENSPLIDRVLAVEFSPDGQWLATGGGMPSRSGEIKIWNVADGKLVRELKDPHSDTVFSLDFSADGKYLASGGADKFAKVFDANTGQLVKSFEGHTHHVLAVSWKRDARTLASAGADKVVKLWNFVTGEQRKTLDGFNKEVTSIAFLDAANEALASSGDAQVKLIREDNNNVRAFGGATEFVTSAAVTPDGKIVIAGGQDSILRVWDGTNGKELRTFAPPSEQFLSQTDSKQ